MIKQFTLFFLFCTTILNAQSLEEKINPLLRQLTFSTPLSKEDIEDWIITDEHISKQSGVHHIYIRQRYKGIEILQAEASYHLKANGQVVKANNHFIPSIANKVKAEVPQLTNQEAILAIAEQQDYTLKESLTTINSPTARGQQSWSTGGISRRPIPTKLVYYPNEAGELILCWEVDIYETDAADWWNFKVDAQSGKIIHQGNYIVHCDWAPKEEAGFRHKIHSSTTAHKSQETSQLDANYNVYPQGIASPIFGSRTLLMNPANPLASPQGWHDINGVAGAEYTITRGNNVWAKEDYAADDEDTFGYSPDGGTTLNFDFPLDFTKTPQENKDAAITNLFYYNNVMHDVIYQYGFDEISGNFQVNNYANGGRANDGLLADAQDGSDTNNADFGTPPDGRSPTMQMYLWNVANLEITNPTEIMGSYDIRTANFGNQQYQLSGGLILVEDAIGIPTEGCSGNYNNAAAIAGNIALIDRGDCQFGTKSLHAQNAGAIAVIVCNNVLEGFTMAPGVDGHLVNIPAISISKADCALLKTKLSSNITVNMRGYFRDSDFDNDIIAHEYAHGISMRLIGGATNTGCMFNSEQMGEGWSDWYALMLNMQADDQGSTPRGVGPYVLGQATSGGLRPYPYSTDMSINPHTYQDVAVLDTPHHLGAAWAVMLWEMTWNLIDKYGFDENIYTGTGGNNIALQLVTEGLKMTRCYPGFEDGRDAILAADTVLYGGANGYEIWKAFAKRGLGLSASQGSNFDETDGIAAFDLPLPFQDSDGDGVPNFMDICLRGNDFLDINQDGIPDLCELCADNTETNIIISKQVLPTQKMDALHSIRTQGEVMVQTSDTVIFRAGNQITLTPGFTVKQGEYFIASIGTCEVDIKKKEVAALPTTTNNMLPVIATTSLNSLQLAIAPNPSYAGSAIPITYQLPHKDQITLSITDVSGRTIAVVERDAWKVAGTYELVYDGTALGAGVYFVMLEGTGRVVVERLFIFEE